jgi:hypothetical protein
VLAEKQKASKDITASATKRKALVDCDTRVEVPLAPGTVEVKSGRQPNKRLKLVKVSICFKLSRTVVNTLNTG